MSPKPKTQPAAKIVQHFEELRDPRVIERSDHPFLTIVVMGIMGVIGGCNGWEDLEEFGKDHREWFETFLDMPKGVPSEDTFRRVIGALAPGAFSRCVRNWIASLAEPLKGQVVAMDGKTLRGALARSPLGTTLHQVHVWATKQRLLLATVGVRGAPEEIDAARDLLKLIDIRGAIVTGDAAHCSLETAREIVTQEADYALSLKANRKALHESLLGSMHAVREGKVEGIKARHHREASKGHGREEIREGWVVDAEALTMPGERYPQLRSVLLLSRTRVTKDGRSEEWHVYISSLKPEIRRLMSVVREHWGVENGLHWVLDVQMNEDRCAIHEANAAENFSTMKTLGLCLLKRDTTVARGIAAKQAKAARNLTYMEHVISLGFPAV